MKRDLIYFRVKRVGSTGIYGGFGSLEENNIIKSWWGKSHMDVSVCRELCIEEKSKNYWDNAIKIVSIRNPWSHQVSRFLMESGDNGEATGYDSQTKSQKKKIIQEFRDLMKKQPSELHPDFVDRNWKIHAIGNKSLADVFIKLENLEASFRDLARKIKCNEEKVLEYFSYYWNPGERKQDHYDRYNWMDFYDDDTKNNVYRLRKPEIDFFNYKFV